MGILVDLWKEFGIMGFQRLLLYEGVAGIYHWNIIYDVNVCFS